MSARVFLGAIALMFLVAAMVYWLVGMDFAAVCAVYGALLVFWLGETDDSPCDPSKPERRG